MRRPTLERGGLRAAVVMLVLAQGAVSQPSPGDDRARLSPREPLSRKIAGKATHHYEVSLATGQYVHVTAEQRGIDLLLTILDPSGKKLIEMDTPSGTRGKEHASCVADVGGTYGIDVQAFGDATSTGTYEIAISDPRPAIPTDRLRVIGEAGLTEGYSLSEQEEAKANQRGSERLKEALDLFHQIGEPEQEAMTAFALARSRSHLSDHAGAVEYFSRALELWRASGDRFNEASALGGRAFENFKLEKMALALADYAEALPIERSLGEKLMEADVLAGIADTHEALGESRKAVEFYTLALPLMRESGNRSGELRIVNNLALVYDYRGERQQALALYSDALRLSREVALRRAESTVLTNMGRLYGDLGDGETARRNLTQALEMSHSLGFRWGEGLALMYLGEVASVEQKWSEASESYSLALHIWREIANRRYEARTLNAIAEICLATGKPERARELADEALTAARGTGNRFLESAALTSIGSALRAQGKGAEALEPLRRANQIRLDLGHREARAQTLLEIARVERDMGDRSASRANSEEALALIESVRGDVASPTLRASFLSGNQKYYQFSVDLLQDLAKAEPAKGWEVLAFQTAERARARSLLDLLSESRAAIEEGVDRHLLEERKALQGEIAGKLERQLRGGVSTEQAAALARDIGTLRTRIEEVDAAIRRASPRYASLTQPLSATLVEVQQELLDGDTILLEYFLGEERSFLWAIGRASFTAYELPSRAIVNEAARGVYEPMTARNLRPTGETAEARKHRLDQANAKYPAAAETLSRMLLGPAAADLAGNRLLIVPDGALQYVPFAALPEPVTSEESGRRPVVARHEVVTLPSASVLSVLRREVAGRPMAAKTVAVLADPVFDRNDERVVSAAGSGPRRSPAPKAHQARAAGGIEPDLLRSAALVGATEGSETRIVRLPFTRREARAILDQVPARSRKEALDFDASRATATSSELSGYRFVHFATHGFLDSLQPELSGLVFSLVDREGRDQPGFLGAADVFNLKLPAELVVLSGCQTALGKEIKGEGLVGLTRAFMYAGAPRVVASLWKVDDVATAELMKRFYAGMLGPKKLRPAAALREAQVAMEKQRRWREPYYWAAFVLQGEWN